MIIVRVIGAKEVAKSVGHISLAVPRFERVVAEDLKKGIRFRIRNRIMNRATILPSSSKGKMWQSVRVSKQGFKRGKASVSHTVVEMGAPTAPHFWFLEVDRSISGYRFVPRKGKGRHGQGYMKRAPMSSLRRGVYIVSDSVKSTERRAPKIILRELEKEIRKAGL